VRNLDWIERTTPPFEKKCRNASGWRIITTVLIYVLCLSLPATRLSLGAEPVELKINYGAVSAGLAPVWVAHDEGFFAKYGLKTDPRLIGAATEVQALLGGSLHIVNCGPELVDARIQGADVVYIAGMVNRFVFSVFSKVDVPKMSDLRGRSIGVTQPNSATDFAARILLKEAGLTPGKDATVLYVKGVPEILAALVQGTVDVGILPPPTTLKARHVGLKEILNVTDKNIPMIQAAVGTTRAFLKDKPDLVKKYLQAYVETLKFMQSEPDKTKKAIGKYTKTTSQEDLDETYRVLSTVWEKVPYVSSAAIQNLLEFSPHPAAKSAKPDQFIDNSFIAELERSGFIAQLYR
jgi:NitT/TauT family transport system substrate-binding protein